MARAPARPAAPERELGIGMAFGTRGVEYVFGPAHAPGFKSPPVGTAASSDDYTAALALLEAHGCRHLVRHVVDVSQLTILI